MISLTKLVELRENLPYGAKKEISKRCGLTRVQVSRILNGKSYNERVINITIEYIKELKQRASEIDKNIELALNLN